MFLDEVSRFSFLKFLTVRQIFASLKSFLKLFPAPTQIFQKPLWMWTAGLNTVLWCYFGFIVLIPPPRAYWIVSKDCICCLDYSITLGTLIHIGYTLYLIPFRGHSAPGFGSPC